MSYLLNVMEIEAATGVRSLIILRTLFLNHSILFPQLFIFIFSSVYAFFFWDGFGLSDHFEVAFWSAVEGFGVI